MKPKLEYFSHGPLVVELQNKLNTLMPDLLPPLKVDGTYGDATVARVKQFQKRRGLFPDGVVGKRTWAAIDGLPLDTPLPPTQAPHPSDVKNLQYKGAKAYSGAAIRCEYGTQHSFLMVPSNGAATAGDCQGWVNIMPFGQCKSHDHPNYQESGDFIDPIMEDVMFHYKGTKRPLCTPVITSSWEGHFTPMGKPSDSAQVIDKSARCFCRYGGKIRFV